MNNAEQQPLILCLDVAGRPTSWAHWTMAVSLYVRNQVAWEAGQVPIRIHGGVNRHGERSVLNISSAIAVRNARAHFQERNTPPLCNTKLFQRDERTCLYCGERFSPADLTRDHVVPTSRGGRDAWGNVVTACKPCNNRKDNRTPEEAGMPLLALPYTPNWVESLLLLNRRVLVDQMDLIRLHLPRRRAIA